MGRKLAGSKVEADQELSPSRRAKLVRQRWRAMSVDDVARIEELPRDWPVLQRLRWALWLNVAAPGAGLMALQRPYNGLGVAAAFFLSAETALLGLLVMPVLLGRVAPTAICMAAVAWLASQVLMLRRMHELQDLQLRLHASTRIEQAREAVSAATVAQASDTDGEAAEAWMEATKLLADAAAYDDEQPDLNWLLAKARTATGPHNEARRQWRRLDQVDSRGRYEGEIRQMLAAKKEVGAPGEAS